MSGGDDVIFKASLDIRDVQKSLDRIEKRLREVEDTGDKSFGGINKSMVKAVATGNILAGVFLKIVGFVGRAVNKIGQFGSSFVKESVRVSQEVEVIRNSLTLLFEGNQEAANAFIEQTLKLSARLKTPFVDLLQFTQGVLPDIGDIDTTFKLVEAATLLGRQSGKATVEIRRAIEELAVGQFRSARQILNLRPEDERRIKEMAKDMGVAAAAADFLTERVKFLAIGLETIEGTLKAAVGDAVSALQRIELQFGDIVTPEITAKINEFVSVFTDNKDDILSVSGAIGTLAADIIDLIADPLIDVFKNFDFKKLFDFIEKTNIAIIKLKEVVNLLVQANDSVPSESMTSFETLTKSISDNIETARVSLVQLIALTKAYVAGLKESPANLFKRAVDEQFGVSLGLDGASQEELDRRLAQLSKSLGTIDEGFTFGAFKQAAFNQEAFDASMKKSLETMNETENEIDALKNKYDELREETDKSTQSAIDSANSILRLRILREEEATAAEAAAEARLNILQKENDLRDKLNKKLIDEAIRAEQARLDAEIDFAQKREDIARRNLQRIEDLERRNRQRIEDLLIDAAIDEQKIIERAAEEEQKIQKDKADKRLQIEIDYRRRLEDIQTQFLDSAEEAEIRQDAIAFFRAKRNRERQIRDAKTQRNRDIEDANLSTQSLLEENRHKREKDLEELRENIKLRQEELQRMYDRELEQQSINNQRALKEQAISEQRKLDELKRENIRRIQQIARDNRDKAAQIEKDLENEYDIFEKWEKAKTALAIAESEKQKNAILNIFSILGNLSAPIANLSGMSTFQQALIGSGFQSAPITSYFSQPQSPLLGGGGLFNNTQSNTFNVSENILSDPVARRQLQNIVSSTVEGIFS